MTTIEKIFEEVRGLLDLLTEDDGSVKPSAEYAGMQARAIVFADLANKELFQIAKYDLEQEEATDITLITDTTEVNAKADLAIAYYISSLLAVKKNPILSQPYMDKYEQLKKECHNKATVEDIIDEYGGVI